MTGAARRGFLSLVAALAGCGSPPPTVVPAADPASVRRIATGEVIGFANGAGGQSWMGIPFAAPPVGDLRWRAPRPAPAWTGRRDALVAGSPCIQFGSRLGGVGEPGSRQGSEDCLYLNVHAPPLDSAARAGARLPVMVWIHGGGNTVGHGAFFDGSALARREGVLLVMPNYRLGPFGWFVPPDNPRLDAVTDDPDRSGNYGNLDVLAALRWVRDNAAAFGGDPGNVTVFGESAGATDALALLVMPGAQGLFQRLILQSTGFGFSRTPAPDSPVAPGAVLRRLLASTGRAPDAAAAARMADTMDVAAQWAFLRGLDPWTLYAGYSAETGTLDRLPSVFQDGQVVRAGDLRTLLTDPALHHDVPVLLGTNRDEPRIFMAFDRRLVRMAFGLPVAVRDGAAYEREARYRALLWKADAVDSVADLLARHGAGAWAYRWDWDEQGTAWGVLDVSRIVGAAHGLEIPFVLGGFDVGPQTRLLYHARNAPGRLALSARMMAYWGAFARTGDPGRGSDGQGAPWGPWGADTSAPRLLVLDTPAGGGIRMEPSAVSRDQVVAMIEREPLDEAGRCDLFRRTFRTRADDWADAAWRRFNGGRCAGPRVGS